MLGLFKQFTNFTALMSFAGLSGFFFHSPEMHAHQQNQEQYQTSNSDKLDALLVESIESHSKRNAQDVANEWAYRAVYNVGCSDFSHYFKDQLLPRIKSLGSRQPNSFNKFTMQNIIWHYAHDRYKAHNRAYQLTTEPLVELSDLYLSNKKLSPEQEERVEELLRQIDSTRNRSISCDKVRPSTGNFSNNNSSQHNAIEDSDTRQVSHGENHSLPSVEAQVSTRKLINRVSSKAVNSVGCANYTATFESDIKKDLIELRRRSDWTPQHLRNVVWGYSHAKYGSFNNAYGQSSSQINQIFEDFLNGSEDNIDHQINELEKIAKDLRIKCGSNSQTHQTQDKAQHQSSAHGRTNSRQTSGPLASRIAQTATSAIGYHDCSKWPRPRLKCASQASRVLKNAGVPISGSAGVDNLVRQLRRVGWRDGTCAPGAVRYVSRSFTKGNYSHIGVIGSDGRTVHNSGTRDRSGRCGIMGTGNHPGWRYSRCLVPPRN